MIDSDDEILADFCPDCATKLTITSQALNSHDRILETGGDLMRWCEECETVQSIIRAPSHPPDIEGDSQ